MLPSLLMFLFFTWQPLISGIFLSFFKTRGYSVVEFIGLGNYQEVITNSSFNAALMNSATYTLWSLVIGFAVPIIVAILLNEIVHINGFFKFSFYFPSMIPGIATYLMWAFMYNPAKWGVLNTIISHLGLQPFGWLNMPHYTIMLIVVTMTWAGFGGTALIYMASLQGINQELYEASSLDGAGFVQRIRYITLPNISGIILLMLIMQIITVFQVMIQPLSMTGGGPNDASLSLMLQSYLYAFNYVKAGPSMAVGVITFLILLIPTSFYFVLSKKNQGSEGQ
ncbi:MAG TPA: sugar ABC transporter permease [Firmicutes bacterium]|nr:sugar ABC transporter permease [Bacillota bacterium]